MKPGVYQLSFRGLSLAEAWRFGREPLKFTIALGLKVVGFKGPPVWLPTHEGEIPCSIDELSTRARLELLPEVEKAQDLGYVNGGFNRLSRNLDPHTKDAFSYMALHEDGRRSIFIGYVLNDSSGALKSTIAVTGSLGNAEHDDIEFVNHRNYMDGPRTSRKIPVEGKTLADIDRAMQDFIARSPSPIQHFPSLEAMKAHAAAMSIKTFDSRIARGLYVFVRPEI